MKNEAARNQCQALGAKSREVTVLRLSTEEIWYKSAVTIRPMRS